MIHGNSKSRLPCGAALQGGSLGHRPGHSDAGRCGWGSRVGTEERSLVLLQADWWSSGSLLEKLGCQNRQGRDPRLSSHPCTGFFPS